MTQTLLKLAADFTVQLTSPVAIGDTTATLTSNVDDDNVALPDGLYGLTIDAGQSNKEYIICTLTGSAVSAVQSVTRQGVATSGFTKAHRRGAKVTITDWAILSRILNNLTGTTGFNSDAPLGYDGAPSSLTGNQFATVNYVLSVVTGGPVTFSTQSLSTQTSGEALAVNDIVYFKESDAKWYKCDADTAATVNDVQIGINQTTAGGADQPVTIVISGPASGFSGLTAGAKYYVSNTAGAISTSAGTTPAFIGYALSTTVILFSSVPYNLPNTGQKQALAGGGAFGTPSSTNKFITESYVSSATGLPIVRTYTSNDTWTKPAGLKYVVVEVQGAGASGGGANSSREGASGGGAGGYSKKIIAAASLGATETVTVGDGGAPVSAANGTDGGLSSFGSHLTANGGIKGLKGSGEYGGAGGTASGGDLNIRGGDGEPSLTGFFTSTGSANGLGGRGGDSMLGRSAQGLIAGADTDGNNGYQYGSGGSGASNDSSVGALSGGAGADGIVIVTEYYS